MITDQYLGIPIVIDDTVPMGRVQCRTTPVNRGPLSLIVESPVNESAKDALLDCLYCLREQIGNLTRTEGIEFRVRTSTHAWLQEHLGAAKDRDDGA